MSWERLAVGLGALWDADTGAGSLDELIGSDLFQIQAPDQQARPYAVLTQIVDEPEDYFDSAIELTTFSWQIAVMMDAQTTSTATTTAIDERLRTVFRRVAPTVDGGYTAHQSFYEGTVQFTQQDDTLMLVQQYRTALSK